MISMENVTYTYSGNQNSSLHNVTLKIDNGKTVLLAGKSGCGKTTILRLINGILSQSGNGLLEGNIFIDGVDVKNFQMWELAKKIGTVFQNPKSQFFNIDTTDEILFGLESSGASHEKMETILEKVTKELKISPLLNRNIFELSGGEKQRIAFASIYAVNPDIYIMDEPSSNLDEEGILKLRENIIRVKKMGKMVVIAEHRLWYIADLIDEAYILQNGRIAKKMNSNEFLDMSDQKRISYGLRNINHVLMPKAVRTKTENVIANGLSVRGISAKYHKRKVWENLSFDINKGKIFAIVGGNGVGKSTLAKIICGLKKSHSGEIYWNGQRVKPKQLRNLCFMVMQDVNAQLFADSVIQEVMLDVEDTPEHRKRAFECLDTCKLLEYKDRHPMNLSGGQKQRLAIADSISVDKKIVIFDEPTSGLDYCHMINFIKVLNKMVKKDYMVVVITHDTEFIDESNAEILSLNNINMIKE